MEEKDEGVVLTFYHPHWDVQENSLLALVVSQLFHRVLSLSISLGFKEVWSKKK